MATIDNPERCGRLGQFLGQFAARVGGGVVWVEPSLEVVVGREAVVRRKREPTISQHWKPTFGHP